MKKYKNLSAGFTLIEVALVIVIGGMVMMAAATMLVDYLQESRETLTQSRMQDIDTAIGQYLSVNGVLPCPANLNDLQDSTTFGKSITDGKPVTTDCYTTATPNGPGTFSIQGNVPPVQIPAVANPNTNGRIVIGAVPTRSLNLPDQEMADAWGSRFVYAVTDYLTVSGSYNPTQGSIALEDGSAMTGNPLVGPKFTPPTYAQYVIVSYGPDRAGAYPMGGTSRGVACPADTLETVNCTLPTATFRKTMLISNQTGKNYFDDYVTYHSQMSQVGILPSGMIVPFANLPPTVCPGGWQYIGTGPACTVSSTINCCQKQ